MMKMSELLLPFDKPLAGLDKAPGLISLLHVLYDRLCDDLGNLFVRCPILTVAVRQNTTCNFHFPMYYKYGAGDITNCCFGFGRLPPFSVRQPWLTDCLF